jgi:anti-sigma factor RsiW
MDITRNVILDLLPLYLADEVSADSRVLIEEFLTTDPELANVVKRSAALELQKDIPAPLTKEDEMEAYKEAKRLMTQRTIVIALIISVVVLSLLGMVWLAVFYLTSA